MPVADEAESFVMIVVVAPNDIATDHAGLFAVAGVVGPVECEVTRVGWASMRL